MCPSFDTQPHLVPEETKHDNKSLEETSEGKQADLMKRTSSRSLRGRLLKTFCKSEEN